MSSTATAISAAVKKPVEDTVARTWSRSSARTSLLNERAVEAAEDAAWGIAYLALAADSTGSETGAGKPRAIRQTPASAMMRATRSVWARPARSAAATNPASGEMQGLAL